MTAFMKINTLLVDCSPTSGSISTGLSTTAAPTPSTPQSAEILLGIVLLPDGARKTKLHTAARDVFAGFGERVIPFDGLAAQQYALVVAARTAVGAPIKELDAQIAAICRARGSALATRNVKDFNGIELPLINPWVPGS